MKNHHTGEASIEYKLILLQYSFFFLKKSPNFDENFAL
jgi:hypothetical protein